MAWGDSVEDKITLLTNRVEIVEKSIYELQQRNKELLAENRKLNEPLRKLKMESKAMSAKANYAKKLLKTLQEVNEVNTADTRGE